MDAGTRCAIDWIMGSCTSGIKADDALAPGFGGGGGGPGEVHLPCSEHRLISTWTRGELFRTERINQCHRMRV